MGNVPTERRVTQDMSVLNSPSEAYFIQRGKMSGITFSTSDTVLIVVRLTLAVVFVLSGIQKIQRPYDFLGTVYSNELVGERLGLFVAVWLPWLELMLGFGIAIGVFLGGHLLAFLGLCIVCLVAQVSVLLRAISVNCGCFSAVSDSPVGLLSLIRTGAVCLAAMFVFGWMLARTVRRCP